MKLPVDTSAIDRRLATVQQLLTTRRVLDEAAEVVREAVEDWPKMRQRALGLGDELEASRTSDTRPPVPLVMASSKSTARIPSRRERPGRRRSAHPRCRYP